jgi:methionyl-tRNA formyltransferase
MRIVFMGTPNFAIPSLEKLMHSPHQVVEVVTVADKPQGRGQKVSASPVKRFAQEQGLPVQTPADLKDAGFVESLRDLKPDLIMVVAFRILPEAVFTLPPLGTVNLHASLLPRYRGAAPINWAIINGETKTGLTTFYIRKKVDTGDVLLQREIHIDPEEDFGRLRDRMAKEGADLLLETVEQIEKGETQPIKQDDAQATPAPKITPEHCRIDWSRTAVQIKNQVRGLSPAPGAFTSFRGGNLKLFKVGVLGGAVAEEDVGRTLAPERKEEMWAGTGEGILSLLELQPEGKRRMTAAEFVRGYRVKPGEQLG